MLKHFLFLSLSSTLFLSFTKKEADYISWSSDRKLSWDDFAADTPPQTADAALTTTYVGFSYTKTGNKIDYDIECKFQKSRSWVRVKSDYILKHEQGHFDIAEIFSRKLNKEIQEYLSQTNDYRGLNPIYTRLMNEKRMVQEAYDEETNHSINKRRQAEWNLRIEKMLDELEPYGNY